MCKGIYDFFKPHPFLPTFHGVRGGIGIGESAKLPQTRANKKYPTYIHPPTVGMTYSITTFIPQIVGWIYPIIYILFKCIFPIVPLTAPTIIQSDQYPMPTYIFNNTYTLKICLKHISNANIYFDICTYIPQPCARRAYRNYPTYIHLPNC